MKLEDSSKYLNEIKKTLLRLYHEKKENIEKKSFFTKLTKNFVRTQPSLFSKFCDQNELTNWLLSIENFLYYHLIFKE